MRLNPTFKTLLILAIVIGPISWLMFTADGQRRSDAMMLSLFGAESMELDLSVGDALFSEPDLRQVYPNLRWSCAEQASDFGDRACIAPIGNYNTLPAHRVAFYFASGRLNALRVDYRARNHPQLLSQLRDQLGTPEAANEVLQWRMPRGLVVVKTELNKDDDAALIWVASRRLPTGAGS